MTKRLFPSFQPTVFRPPCDYGQELVSVIARTEHDLSPVFPYLNATLPEVHFQAGAGVIRFRYQGRTVTMQPHEIAVSGLEDADEAIQFIAEIQELVNRTWENRQTIFPSFQEHRRPGVLELYRLLPGTNCRRCGEPTCFVFAARLACGLASPRDCLALAENDSQGHEQRLGELLDSAAWPDSQEENISPSRSL